jgi:hypothetical protein
MKSKHAWLVVVLGVICGAGSAGAAENLVLRLVVHQPGVVRLDGDHLLDFSVRSGRAPDPWRRFVMQTVPVAPGKHTLTLRPDDPHFVSPYEEVTVEGAAGDTVGVVLGRPLLSTSPPGARVLVNGKPEGNTPLYVNPADLVKTGVQFELEGYRSETVPGDSVLAVAEEGGAYRLELFPENVEASRIPLGEPRSYWDNNRTLLIGGSLALLTAGIYTGLRYKDRADEIYSEYERTGSRERQDELFHKAERFDRLSLLGWGVGELAFLATFFLIIHDEPRGLIPTARLDTIGPSGESNLKVGFTHDF